MRPIDFAPALLSPRRPAIRLRHWARSGPRRGWTMIRRTWQAACCAVLAVGIAAAQAPEGPAAATVNGVKVPLADLDAELKTDPAADAPTRARRMEALGLLI